MCALEANHCWYAAVVMIRFMELLSLATTARRGKAHLGKTRTKVEQEVVEQCLMIKMKRLSLFDDWRHAIAFT